MKKIFTSVITSVLIIGGITSTSFAAANPFSDISSDSWVYEAVSSLVANGVIDGYTDGTYQGKNKMTRYEMAQIVARAMTKTDLNKADKAVIDKLSIEFADELNNLGIRVTELEKKSSNLKWTGKVKYKYTQEKHDEGKNKHSSKLELKLYPKAYIGDSGYTANACLKYVMYPEKSSNAELTVEQIYVKGPLWGTTIMAGRMPLDITQEVLFDDELTGIVTEFGSNVFNTKLYIGRYNEIDGDEKGDTQSNKDVTADFYGVQFDYTPMDKLALNAGYIKLSGLDDDYLVQTKDNKANIWYVGTDYEFANNLKFIGEFVQNTEAEIYGNAWTAEIQYKEVKSSVPNSWEIYAGYRNFGKNVTIETGFDDADADQKGFVVGGAYTFVKNVIGKIQYFNGKDISTNTDASKVYTNLEFKF